MSHFGVYACTPSFHNSHINSDSTVASEQLDKVITSHYLTLTIIVIKFLIILRTLNIKYNDRQLYLQAV